VQCVDCGCAVGGLVAVVRVFFWWVFAWGCHFGLRLGVMFGVLFLGGLVWCAWLAVLLLSCFGGVVAARLSCCGFLFVGVCGMLGWVLFACFVLSVWWWRVWVWYGLLCMKGWGGLRCRFWLGVFGVVRCVVVCCVFVGAGVFVILFGLVLEVLFVGSGCVGVVGERCFGWRFVGLGWAFLVVVEVLVWWL